MMNLVYPKYKAWKADGISPAVGYYLYTYATGGTTAKTTYSDSELSSPNANPIILDANGEANIFLGPGGYRLDLKTPAGVLINTFDPVNGDTESEVSTFNAAIVGLTTADIVIVKATKVGNIVSLIIPTFLGTSNAPTLSITGLPESLRPATSQAIQNIDITNNGTVYPGQANISNNSAITFSYKATFGTAPTATFTSSGDKGLSNGVSTFFTLNYSLQ